MDESTKRSIPPLWLAAAPLILKAGVVWLALAGRPRSRTRTKPPSFPCRPARQTSTCKRAAAFARKLDPNVEISFWDSQSGSLSVSRVEGDRVKCILRESPDIGEAVKPLGRFLNGRIEPHAQALFAMAHEVGHCKLRDAFLNRPDGSAADAGVFPWLAQEAAADALLNPVGRTRAG